MVTRCERLLRRRLFTRGLLTRGLLTGRLATGPVSLSPWGRLPTAGQHHDEQEDERKQTEPRTQSMPPFQETDHATAVISVNSIMTIVCNNTTCRVVYGPVSSQGMGGVFVSWIKGPAG